MVYENENSSPCSVFLDRLLDAIVDKKKFLKLKSDFSTYCMHCFLDISILRKFTK